MNGCARDHDELVATYASLLIIEANFDADPADRAKAMLFCVTEIKLETLARACGYVRANLARRLDGDDLRRWVEHRAEVYGRVIRDAWPR